MNRGAISGVITTVLIVLITIVAVGSVAVVVINLNENAGEQISEEFNTLVEDVSGGDNTKNAAAPAKACGDGIDNDGDGYADEDDSGCADAGEYDSQIDDETSSEMCNPNPDPENLVLNGRAECDLDGDNLPDSWVVRMKDTERRTFWEMDFIGTGHGMVLKTENIGNPPSGHLGWEQKISLKPNTWYEFSADIATENLQPTLAADNSLDASSDWAGVSLIPFNTENQKISGLDVSFWSTGIIFSDWDESSWTYRTFDIRGIEPWRTYRRYIKTSDTTSYAYVYSNYNYPRGKVYADNIAVKEVSRDPTLPEFKKSGILKFTKYKGEIFFPIVALGFPKLNGNMVSIDEVKNAGFNTVWGTSYNGLSNSELKQLWTDEDIAVLLSLTSFHYTINSALPDKWMNDPQHLINYDGVSIAKKSIDDWGDYENLLFILAPDESDCPGNGLYYGVSISSMNKLDTLNAYSHQNAPEAKLLYNFCGSERAYTGLVEDKENYFYSKADVITNTENLGIAYPSENRITGLDKNRLQIRRAVDYINSNEGEKNVIAFGIGVYPWTTWDGVITNPPWTRYNVYLPLNLQRYQIWSQIINGATGVWFYGLYKMSIEDPYYGNHWNQVKMLSKEIGQLKEVLLEPEFYDEWSVSDDRIEIMMKKYDGKIYLFAASNHYEDLSNVQISLSGEYSVSPTLIFVSADGVTGGSGFVAFGIKSAIYSSSTVP